MGEGLSGSSPFLLPELFSGFVAQFFCPRKDGAIERRRRCQVCGASFATREVFERFLDRRIDYGD